MTYLEALEPLAPTLAILLVGLVAVWRIQNEFRPIIIGVVKGLTTTAQSNALYFAMLILCGLNAMFPALATIAAKFHWQYVEAFAIVAAGGCSAVLSFMIKPPPTSFTSPEIKTVILQPPEKSP